MPSYIKSIANFWSGDRRQHCLEQGQNEKVRRIWVPLDDHALTYFNNLSGDYRSMSKAGIDQSKINICDDILKKNKDDCLNWEDIFTFDHILLQIKCNDPEKLTQVVRSLRSRYLHVVGQHGYDAYISSKPMDLSDASHENTHRLLAEAEFLLGEIHLRYALASDRENARIAISTRVMRFMYAVIAILLCFFALSIYGKGDSIIGQLSEAIKVIPEGIAILVLVFLVGAMGGLVSILQRFQGISDEGDPLYTVFQLKHGGISVKSSAIGGAISAVILYLVIAGGLLEGALFPKFTLSEDNSTREFLKGFLTVMTPYKAPDYAKLVVWSFIAGFAERFVPDTLSRFAAARPSTVEQSIK
jgi:hypothetical protein